MKPTFNYVYVCQWHHNSTYYFNVPTKTNGNYYDGLCLTSLDGRHVDIETFSVDIPRFESTPTVFDLGPYDDSKPPSYYVDLFKSRYPELLI